MDKICDKRGSFNENRNYKKLLLTIRRQITDTYNQTVAISGTHKKESWPEIYNIHGAIQCKKESNRG